MDNSEQGIEMDDNCAQQNVETKNENAELEKQTMEASSSMDNKNVSDEIGNKEQKSIKKRIKFGGWLPDVLDWFKRPELAQSSLSTSSYIFNRYCWPKLHGNKVKERIVRELTFSRRRDSAGNWQTILETDRHILPIDINPPEYIIGFKEINFRFIDDRVLQFMANILPLLNEVKIHFRHDYLRYIAQIASRILRTRHLGTKQFGADGSKHQTISSANWRVRKRRNTTQISPTKRLMEMLAPKTNQLEFYRHLNEFDRQFPNFIPGLQSICLLGWIAKDIVDVDLDLHMEWLTTTPRKDGKPKMLTIYSLRYSHVNALINRVKTEFIHSTESANFIICIYILEEEHEHFEDFKIENETTKEMLELQWKEPNKYLIVRHKNDTETTAKVDDWEEQMELKSNTKIGIMICKDWEEWEWDANIENYFIPYAFEFQ